MNRVRTVLLLMAVIGLGTLWVGRIIPTAKAGDCDGLPAGADVTTAQLVKKQMTSLRYEHQCLEMAYPTTAAAIAQQAANLGKEGWQIASFSEIGDKKAALCLKRVR